MTRTTTEGRTPGDAQRRVRRPRGSHARRGRPCGRDGRQVRRRQSGEGGLGGPQDRPRRRKLEQALEVARAERARIDAWIAGQEERAEQACAFFEDLLQRFHRRQLDEDPKAKTIRLPAGELVARKQPDTLVWDGGEDTIEWAETNAPELVVVKKSIDRVKARQRLGMSNVETPDGFEAVDPTTGQVVGGCWFRPGDVKFTVKTEAAG